MHTAEVGHAKVADTRISFQQTKFYPPKMSLDRKATTKSFLMVMLLQDFICMPQMFVAS